MTAVVVVVETELLLTVRGVLSRVLNFERMPSAFGPFGAFNFWRGGRMSPENPILAE